MRIGSEHGGVEVGVVLGDESAVALESLRALARILVRVAVDSSAGSWLCERSEDST